MNWELQIINLDLEKAEEPEIKLPTSAGPQKNQENSRKKQKTKNKKHLLLLNWLWKAFDCVDYNNLWQILKQM